MAMNRLNSWEENRLAALRSLHLSTRKEERFDRLTRIARHLFDVPHSFIGIIESERQWFKSIDGLNLSETPRCISFCSHTIEQDGVMVVNDARKDERFADNPIVLKEPGIIFYAGCPLRDPTGMPIGALCVSDTEPRTFGQAAAARLRDLADIAEHEIAMTQMATVDSLTGLNNRRGFSYLALHAIELYKRLHYPVTLTAIDLDGLKVINDAYGYAAGDKLLVDFSTILKAQLRDSDVSARLGGDEFAIITPGIGTDAIDKALFRIRKAVEAYNADCTVGREISFSAGSVTEDPTDGIDIDKLLHDADTVMYNNKRRKRLG
jgi:diguanylate cyclase (GGDEF)-like protein